MASGIMYFSIVGRPSIKNAGTLPTNSIVITRWGYNIQFFWKAATTTLSTSCPSPNNFDLRKCSTTRQEKSLRHGTARNSGSGIQDPGSGIQGRGSWIQDSESWILNPGFRIKDSGSFIRIYDFRNISFRHGSARQFRHRFLFGTDRHGTARNITD